MQIHTLSADVNSFRFILFYSNEKHSWNSTVWRKSLIFLLAATSMLIHLPFLRLRDLFNEDTKTPNSRGDVGLFPNSKVLGQKCTSILFDIRSYTHLLSLLSVVIYQFSSFTFLLLSASCSLFLSHLPFPHLVKYHYRCYSLYVLLPLPSLTCLSSLSNQCHYQSLPISFLDDFFLL